MKQETRVREMREALDEALRHYVSEETYERTFNPWIIDRIAEYMTRPREGYCAQCYLWRGKPFALVGGLCPNPDCVTHTERWPGGATPLPNAVAASRSPSEPSDR